MSYSKTCLKRSLKKKTEIGCQVDYCLMQVKSIAECSKGEHSAILSTFIKLPFAIKTFVCLFLSGHLRQVLHICIPMPLTSFRQHFQTSYSLKSLGQSNSGSYGDFLEWAQMFLVTCLRWPPHPYKVKTL